MGEQEANVPGFRMMAAFSAGMLAGPSVVIAQFFRIHEVEDAAIVCARGTTPQRNLLASGQHLTPDGWGGSETDSVEWRIDAARAVEGAKVGVRYARDMKMLLGWSGGKEVPSILYLQVDELPSIPLQLPDTGGWGLFEIATAELPTLAPGGHVFRIAVPTAPTAVNIDAMFLFGGDADIPAQFRKSVVAASADGRFAFALSPTATLRHDPQRVLADFARIDDYLQDLTHMQLEHRPVVVCLFDHRIDGGTRMQWRQDSTLWFDDDTGFEPGGWCHELNHLYTRYFPHQMGHPMIRLNDVFITVPRLFPDYYSSRPLSKTMRDERTAAGRRLLDDPDAVTSDPHDVMYAYYLRHGEAAIRRFHVLMEEDAKSGKLKLENGEMSFPTFVEYLARAAERSPIDLFMRLKGYPNAVPET